MRSSREVGQPELYTIHFSFADSFPVREKTFLFLLLLLVQFRFDSLHLLILLQLFDIVQLYQLFACLQAALTPMMQQFGALKKSKHGVSCLCPRANGTRPRGKVSQHPHWPRKHILQNISLTCFMWVFSTLSVYCVCLSACRMFIHSFP